jgi:phage tail sheath protein FI
VHKAPANEVLEGVLELERQVTRQDQDYLNPRRVNCLRSFPGRGIRVWGARTLAGHDAWTYVNVRRLFLTAVRWINWHMADVVFEPNDVRLWARIERDLNAYFVDLYQRGALKGRGPQEAFYVKCNEETNPPEVRDLGQVITEIGLAPANPYEFVVVRLIHGASGVSISGPIRPEQNL